MVLSESSREIEGDNWKVSWRYEALEEVANSCPASSHILWYLDLDFISITDKHSKDVSDEHFSQFVVP